MPSSRLTIFVAAALGCAAAFAQSLPMASHPEDVGFSSKRLEVAKSVFKNDVDTKRVPGAVLLIARNGKIAFFDAVGYQDRAAQTPMKKDSIFRIASMSKPITTVAAMILAEEDKLDVSAPVAQYLPEFKDVKVGPEGAPPKRPMTVQDLMRHTSGLTYGLFGNSPVDQMYRKANILGPGSANSLADMVKTIASMPLLHQPGEFWEYSVGVDVLGRVVEVASGMDLDSFVRARITGPLKMNDTGFWVKPEAVSRLAKSDAPNPLFEDATQKPKVFSGGGGMLSTAGDYARFSQMLLNGGELEGVRILSPKTIALMTSDQLPPGVERHTPVAMAIGPFGPVPEMGTSFGLGFAIRVDPGRNPMPGSVGDFSWGGITGTLFWVDPQTKLVAVLMDQTSQLNLSLVWRQARVMVYQAMTN
ncbi:MAG TPA: serine hydrolase domain-containing protein [Bryobacteraceae bacterium]|nr:serine hydrolase domain-containing protein [Bryobacteraceae bacterium]